MKKVIAAVRDEEAFSLACKSNVEIIFDLSPSIDTIEKKAVLSHECGKLLFIHMDLAEGIGKDKAGIAFAKRCGADGVISTRAAIIKLANEADLKTVQRAFILDSQSLDTAVAMLKSKPDMAEIMPGVISGTVIEEVCRKLNIPVIAGGLISTQDEVETAISAGASAVSTGKAELWNY